MSQPTRRQTQLAAPPVTAGALRMVGALVFVTTFCAFIPALSAGFSDFDDPGVILDVTGYRGLGPANLVWMFTTTTMGHYHPLTWLSYAIDFSLWGLDPRGFHATNIFVHSINAVLVYVLSLQLLALPRPGGAATQHTGWPVVLGSAAAALLFSVHPLRAESVAWITERRDVLSGCFLLLTTLAYLRAFPPGLARPGSSRWYWVSIGLLLLSLLCKAWGMSFFVVALILDLYPLRRLPVRPWHWLAPAHRVVLLQKLPYALLGVASAIAAAWAQGSTEKTVKTLAQWGVPERAVQAGYGLFFYAEKTLAPIRLAALCQLPLRVNPWEPRFIVAYAVLLVAVGVLIAFRKRIPALLAAAAIYAVMLAPVLGTFQSGIQFVADRYSYLACIGWAIVAGGLVAGLFARARSGPGRTSIVLAATCLIGLLGVLTWRQSATWSDTQAQFKHAIDIGWDGPIIRELYALQLEKHGRRDLAINELKTAVEMDPTDGSAWFSLGNVYRGEGAATEAEKAYFQAVKTMPEAWRGYVALGIVQITRLNHPYDALVSFRAAVADVERPGRPPSATPGGGGVPYMMLAAALDQSGDPRASRAMLAKAAQFEPSRKEALERMQEVDEELRSPP